MLAAFYSHRRARAIIVVPVTRMRCIASTAVSSLSTTPDGDLSKPSPWHG